MSGAELQVRDYDRLEETTYQIAADLNGIEDKYGEDYCVRNVEELNPQIFSWLSILDVNIWVILILMAGVAGFTMVSGLLIIIIERTSMIGVLKSLGANNTTIRKVFLWFQFSYRKRYAMGQCYRIGILFPAKVVWNLQA